MLLRSRSGRGLGASEVGGVLRGSPPTPGTIASVLGVTAAPLGMSPRPLFASVPFAVDYQFPTVPPVPTAAGALSTAMQPMGSTADAGNTSSGDPNMPLQLHGFPPSLTPMFTPGPTSVDYAPNPVPPVAPTSTGYGVPADQLPQPLNPQLAAPGLVHLLNPFDPQRSVPAIVAVAGGGVLALVLLLRR